MSATVVRLINAAGKPAVYAERDFIAAGGLVMYGHDIDDAFRRGASIVDRVLKGASPANTPFEQPTASRSSSTSKPRRRSVRDPAGSAASCG